MVSVADMESMITELKVNTMRLDMNWTRDFFTNPVTETYDPLNHVTTIGYDNGGQPTSVQGPIATEPSTTFAYDPLNRRIQATYPDATTRFIYDSVGRLVKAADTAPGAETIDFAYDVLDRLLQETTGQGTVSYQYDVLGRRTQMTSKGGDRRPKPPGSDRPKPIQQGEGSSGANISGTNDILPNSGASAGNLGCKKC